MSTKLGEEDTLRKKVWRIINLIQANQLFVHYKDLSIKYLNENSKKISTKKLPEILSLCVLNAIVPNSAMLLVGGHGGGKTTLTKLLGRMFTANSLNEIEKIFHLNTVDELTFKWTGTELNLSEDVNSKLRSGSIKQIQPLRKGLRVDNK